MSKPCKVCGKAIPDTTQSGKCLECCKKSIQEIFKKDPELKEAFKETIQEMRKPENVKRMAEDTVKFIRTIQEVQNGKKQR